MKIGILKEPAFENRVAITPENVAALLKLKVQAILVESDAGKAAFVSNADYEAAGATIGTADDIIKNADIIVKIHPLDDAGFDKLAGGKVYLAMLSPLSNKPLVNAMLAKNITSFSLDNIPRTTRAQAMDVLSSMATAAGYKAVLLAATHLPTFFPMFMTAAGTIKPAKVLILGAGVAGLQAIATARRLGAVVEAFDVRAAAKEEVLSLGAKFVEVEGAADDKAAGGYAVEQDETYKKRQAQLIHDHALQSNVVICTAQIPGRKAPLLIPKNTIEQMKAGAVIVDLAASTGGNCELTQNDQIISHNGVTIIGNSNLPASIPADASKMFGKNVVNLLKLIIDKEGQLNLNFEDDIVKGTCVTHNGQIVSERVAKFLS